MRAFETITNNKNNKKKSLLALNLLQCFSPNIYISSKRVNTQKSIDNSYQEAVTYR